MKLNKIIKWCMVVLLIISAALAIWGAAVGYESNDGQPIDVMQPECMKIKAIEPVLLLGAERFANLDIHLTVKGGGRVAQIYGRQPSSYCET